jgi:hypothetical protein
MTVQIAENGRVFEAIVGSMGCHLAEVTFYEVVRPTWKIFRTKFFPLGSRMFSVDDYENIIDGVRSCLLGVIAEEEHDQEVMEKWKTFEKSLDKSRNL